MIILALLFSLPPVFADDTQLALLDCARALAPTLPGRIARPTDSSAVIADWADGWALRVFEGALAYRCALPAAVEACFRANSKCPAFDLLIAHPGPGVSATFDGAGIDDHARPNRLIAAKPLPRGTVDENGLIARVIRAPRNPVLGLKCVVDRGPAATAALERALSLEILNSRRTDPSCARLPRRDAPRPGDQPGPSATAR